MQTEIMQRFRLWALLPLLVLSSNSPGASLSDTARKLPIMQVQVTLSPAAKKTLTQGQESITLAASWYGWPAPQWQHAANEVGQINLGQAEITLPATGGVTRFTPSMMELTRLSWIKGDAYINVNAWSARHHWPDNILACDFIDGALVKVGSHPITLHCSLIKERADTRLIEN